MRRLLVVVIFAAVSIAVGLPANSRVAAQDSGLNAIQFCSYTQPGLVTAEISWLGVVSSQTVMDVSDSDTYWLPGAFVSIPLAPEMPGRVLSGLLPNSTYYVRLGQQLVNGTIVYSPTYVLQSQSCFYVPPQALPYGAYLGQNPNEGPRIVTAMSSSSGGSITSTSVASSGSEPEAPTTPSTTQ